jgi:hypothetical protein
VLLFCIDAVTLDDVVVIVGAFKSGLHASELMLHAIQLDTSLFTGLSDFANFFLFLAKLEVDTFVFVRQLFSQGILEPCHQRLKMKRSVYAIENSLS